MVLVWRGRDIMALVRHRRAGLLFICLPVCRWESLRAAHGSHKSTINIREGETVVFMCRGA